MFASDFQQKLKKLNSKLRIYCGDSDKHPASLFYVQNGEEITVCGIDKNELPRTVIYDNKGHIIKSGWERVLNILVYRRLTTKQRAEKIFNCHLYKTPEPIIEDDEIQKFIKNANQGNWHRDDLAEIGSKV